MIIKEVNFKKKTLNGLTLFPFIFIREGKSNDKILINHESIHIQQQKELLVIFFYLFYISEYLIRYFMYKNWYKAYRNISFENEAYFYENDLNFLKKRKLFNFIRFYK